MGGVLISAQAQLRIVPRVIGSRRMGICHISSTAAMSVAATAHDWGVSISIDVKCTHKLSCKVSCDLWSVSS